MEHFDLILAEYGVWTPALETQRVKAQQKPAPVSEPTRPIGAPRQRVLAVLNEDPAHWWSYAALSIRCHLSSQTVRNVVMKLREARQVEMGERLRGGSGGSFRVVRRGMGRQG